MRGWCNPNKRSGSPLLDTLHSYIRSIATYVSLPLLSHHRHSSSARRVRAPPTSELDLNPLPEMDPLRDNGDEPDAEFEHPNDGSFLLIEGGVGGGCDGGGNGGLLRKLRGLLGFVWWIGKKIAIAGVAIASAPFVLPTLAAGFAFAVPFGVLFAGYACMSKMARFLQPRPKEGLLECVEKGNEGLCVVGVEEMSGGGGEGFWLEDITDDKEEKEQKGYLVEESCEEVYGAAIDIGGGYTVMSFGVAERELVQVGEEEMVGGTAKGEGEGISAPEGEEGEYGNTIVSTAMVEREVFVDNFEELPEDNGAMGKECVAPMLLVGETQLSPKLAIVAPMEVVADTVESIGPMEVVSIVSLDGIGPTESEIMESIPKVVVREMEVFELPIDEGLYSEPNIWDQIDAIRTIVGYNPTRSPSFTEEVKALYHFIGVELPESIDVSSDIAEVRNKLQFLKFVVGVK